MLEVEKPYDNKVGAIDDYQCNPKETYPKVNTYDIRKGDNREDGIDKGLLNNWMLCARLGRFMIPGELLNSRLRFFNLLFLIGNQCCQLAHELWLILASHKFINHTNQGH